VDKWLNNSAKGSDKVAVEDLEKVFEEVVALEAQKGHVKNEKKVKNVGGSLSLSAKVP